ncbi:Uncharacterized protein dnl_06910 [Desulfonema limicola]|uniref:Uncharacterized protein n=1 Tax=Desulfonema limicola TaxID=45656 RepID=A0A975B458_9BACT|nr:Uncharacterized protein dnl_06910 [Desulfonema limicola]
MASYNKTILTTTKRIKKNKYLLNFYNSPQKTQKIIATELILETETGKQKDNNINFYFSSQCGG